MSALERVRLGYDALLDQDFHLLATDANERSLTHRLAEHLHIEFPTWDIDCEYNRDGHEVKTLDGPVAPDIIIHRRGTSENFVVIEAKKSSTSRLGRDREKLALFKSKLGYKVAIEVVFPVGGAAGSADASIDVVEVS